MQFEVSLAEPNSALFLYVAGFSLKHEIELLSYFPVRFPMNLGHDCDFPNSLNSSCGRDISRKKKNL